MVTQPSSSPEFKDTAPKAVEATKEPSLRQALAGLNAEVLSGLGREEPVMRISDATKGPAVGPREEIAPTAEKMLTSLEKEIPEDFGLKYFA